MPPINPPLTTPLQPALSEPVAGTTARRPGHGPLRRRISGDDFPQVRLFITLPTVLILLTLGYGLISYHSFSNRWEALVAAGAGELAGDLLRVHLITMLVLAVVAVLMGLTLTYTIVRPIRALTATARMVAQGRFDAHAPPIPAAPEFEELSRSFNSMLEEVHRSIDQRNRCLMNNIPIGVLTVDMDGCVSAVNPVGADLLGVAPERLVGQPLATLEESLFPPAHPLARFCVQALREPLSCHTNEVSLDVPAVAGSGSNANTLKVSTSHLLNEQQRPYGMVFSFRETGTAENLSIHLSRTDQLAALGTFCLGLAHQLRNPLGAIKGLSQLLQLEQDLPQGSQDYLDRMVHEVDRVDTFVHQLLEMDSPPGEPLMATDLGDVLKEADQLARKDLPADKHDSVACEHGLGKLPPLMLETGRVTQALAHLLRNAYQYTPSGGRITIQTGLLELDGRPHPTVSITNTGATIPHTLRERIFEPFFSTSERATGLGLTVANQILAQNGAALDLEVSTEAVTFTIRFDSNRCVYGSSEPADAIPPTGGIEYD